ncbi:MAG: hypothetical protein EZS28_044042 [Streblomastix strix]|uniref:Uncharacterized protein n=1 Tax=Streblomastix strix TaxID=222440 RepID=A0A5J4TSI2_9EUKA|nr:MAG: hypothetical protein EZS28_044042 [Streblomastix strix]
MIEQKYELNQMRMCPSGINVKKRVRMIKRNKIWNQRIAIGSKGSGSGTQGGNVKTETDETSQFLIMHLDITTLNPNVQKFAFSGTIPDGSF